MSLTDKEVDIVDRAKEIYKNKTKIGCTECRYCMPCPSGVLIPNIFSIYNELHMYDTTEESLGTYERIMKEQKDASVCIECGQCESACPQNLTIIEHLKDAHKGLNKNI